MRKNNWKVILGVIIIILSFIFIVYNGLKGTSLYYLTVSEFTKYKFKFNEEGLRISGKVLKGSIKQGENPLEIRFVIFDKETEDKLDVNYKGIIPDTFKDDSDVLIEGVYKNNIFNATTIFTKCPSKYESKKD